MTQVAGYVTRTGRRVGGYQRGSGAPRLRAPRPGSEWARIDATPKSRGGALSEWNNIEIMRPIRPLVKPGRGKGKFVGKRHGASLSMRHR